MTIRTKIILGIVVAASAVAYVAYLGASTSWQYYMLVDECYVQSDRLIGKRLRISGRVQEGSLQVSENRRHASFTLAGSEHKLSVSCGGPLPDNLAEKMEVVVEGKMGADCQIEGNRVITRCASKYAADESSGKADEAEKMAR
jgi:cytochrome c-type biogenesis protein CcmE